MLLLYLLIFKDLKLNTLKNDLLPMIVQLLYQLATDLKLEEYIYHYWKDYPFICNRNNLSSVVSIYIYVYIYIIIYICIYKVIYTKSNHKYCVNVFKL